MTEFKEVLNLPVDDLAERKRILKEELKKVVIELTFKNLKEELKDKFDMFGIKRVTWEFHGEYDDEGGTDWIVSCFNFYDTNGENIDGHECKYKEKSKYSDSVYEHDLLDLAYDVISDYNNDLYEYDIEELTLE